MSRDITKACVHTAVSVLNAKLYRPGEVVKAEHHAHHVPAPAGTPVLLLSGLLWKREVLTLHVHFEYEENKGGKHFLRSCV